MLKTHTREVLYERFRTEKLLVRRATQKIGEKEAKRLFEGAQRLSMSRHSDLADVRTYRRSRALTYLSFLCLIMEETSATRSPSHTRSFIILFPILPIPSHLACLFLFIPCLEITHCAIRLLVLTAPFPHTTYHPRVPATPRASTFPPWFCFVACDLVYPSFLSP